MIVGVEAAVRARLRFPCQASRGHEGVTAASCCQGNRGASYPICPPSFVGVGWRIGVGGVGLSGFRGASDGYVGCAEGLLWLCYVLR